MVKVYLCDDVPEFRALMRGVLTMESDMEVIGEAGDGLAGVRGVRELQPDVVLLDLSMPELDGLQALGLMRESVPGVRVVGAQRRERAERPRPGPRPGRGRLRPEGRAVSEIVAAVRG